MKFSSLCESVPSREDGEEFDVILFALKHRSVEDYQLVLMNWPRVAPARFSFAEKQGTDECFTGERRSRHEDSYW